MTASERIRQAREARASIVKTSAEYGWLSIARTEYEKMLRHDYAGPEGDGIVWVLSMDESGATVLYKGVTVDESA